MLHNTESYYSHGNVSEGTTHCMLHNTESYYSHGNVCLRVLDTVCCITLSHIIVMVMFV